MIAGYIGAPSSIMFIGTCDIPIILPNERRPKYSPRIDVLIGLRPPKPMPNSIANENTTTSRGTFRKAEISGTNTSTTTALACIDVNTKYANRFEIMSPTYPPTTWKIIDIAV